MKRTATSTRDLERVEVMGRVAQEGLNLVDAAAMMQFSYRKAKRIRAVSLRPFAFHCSQIISFDRSLLSERVSKASK